MSEMRQVRRKGEPVTEAGRVRVSLTPRPPLGWFAAFRAGARSVDGCDPARLVLGEDTVVFECDEDRLEAWLAALDRWIIEANRAWMSSPRHLGPRQGAAR